MAFGMTIRRALSTTSCDQRFHDFESLVNCIRPESRSHDSDSKRP